MKKDFVISNISYGKSKPSFPARMLCEDKECYCYGKICLVSEGGKGNCSSGNIFINARALCAPGDLSWEFGRTVCQALGFQDAVRKRVTPNQ